MLTAESARRILPRRELLDLASNTDPYNVQYWMKYHLAVICMLIWVCDGEAIQHLARTLNVTRMPIEPTHRSRMNTNASLEVTLNSTCIQAVQALGSDHCCYRLRKQPKPVICWCWLGILSKEFCRETQWSEAASTTYPKDAVWYLSPVLRSVRYGLPTGERGTIQYWAKIRSGTFRNLVLEWPTSEE